ncbi:hypothetical protein C5B42_04960 [Candidatus Cerribacteria bacterium 'Amazon FNV 2010 28 9']|uniref:Glycosyltransferase RgtA/B/C/D-like domain-containing protein n=1 Tax=Candidatus Cerribacteria bacterium 'Amazon FNV 2010 28 9' TaxID=2081795 RepID=A0A317JMT7_9BACT|nr:MAG: hypothetical protein C5B42_04960 [Candidatus Cerribacteria bacterium 'Amazon FNV 2010 28 9']
MKEKSQPQHPVSTLGRIRLWCIGHMTTCCLFVIIVLASALRFYNIAHNPPSMYWDENALAYDAYSILKTGKDHHGNPYPIVAFPSFGDYKPGGYIYAIVPFEALFGLNSFATRLPSALSGIIAVVCLFFIGKELVDERLGLMASFLYAVQPWSLQFSRAGFEVNMATMLLTVGALCLLRSRKHQWVLVPSILFFVLSMYTYQAARVFAPLMGIVAGVLLLIYWLRSKISWKKWVIPSIATTIVAFLCIAPIVLNLHSATVNERLAEVGIFTDLNPIVQSNALIAQYHHALWARLVFHRDIFFFILIVKQWITFFSPSFLFLRGDGNLRHSTDVFGLLYQIEAIFIGAGLLAFLFSLFCYQKLPSWFKLSSKQKQLVTLCLVWIAIAAIPGAMATPVPHGLRFLLASPAFALISAFGLLKLVESRWKWQLNIRRIIVVGALGVSITSYLWYYQTVYPMKASADWQYGYTQMYNAVFADKKANEQVYVTTQEGRPSMYYFVASHYDPSTLQQKGPSLPKNQLEIIGIDDYHFVDQVNGSMRGLFATALNQVDPKANVLDTIKRLDGSVVWVIWRRE